MGCLYSTARRSSRVQPLNVGQASADFRRDNTDLENSSEGNHIRVNSASANQSLRNRNSTGKQRLSITNSLRSGLQDDRSLDEERGLSATSESSKHSADSGLGGDTAYIITEYSHQHLVDQVESNFCEKEGLQLEILGTQCPTRLTVKQQKRQEESLVLQALREEGFVSKPKAQSAGGVSFEIVKAVSDEYKLRPPARLAKLQKKRQKKIPTEDQIKEKLKRAERRRKEREEEKLKKVIKRSETVGRLEDFAERQKERLEEQTERMGSVIGNREKRLVEIREKMKERERHAEDVRKRKKINLDCMTSSPEREYGKDTTQ